MSEAAAGRRRGKWWAAAALLVAAGGFAVLLYGRIGENLVYYWGPTELHAAGAKAIGASIRLGGMVVPGSVKRGDGSALQFEVTDRKTSVIVRTTGLPPQMFREGIGVVVEGTMTASGTFQGNRLMVSHGNEYRRPGEKHEDINMRKLIESTEGLKEGEK